MKTDLAQQDSSFTDLVSYEHVRVAKIGHSGTILKAASVEARGSRKIEIESGEADEPGIILHRNGDAIESIEVVCKCGRCTEIRLGYDGD
jgi:hypothetical protein